MSTPREPSTKHEILERIGEVASAEELAEILHGLQDRHPVVPILEPEPIGESLPLTGPSYDPLATEDEELLGPARQSDRSWGGLAAAAFLLVALLGAFLWYQRPASNSEPAPPPPFAPPAVSENAVAPRVEEPDAPPPAEPEIIEEMPAEPESAPSAPEVEAVPEPRELVQIADVQEPEPPAVRPSIPVTPPLPVPMPARRLVPSGPPAERMAGVLRPGPGVEMPVPLELPAARFPSAARGQGLKVDVHLDLLVDEEGKVIDALVREGDTSGLGFNEAAVNAARRTRFQPATRWDLPGKAWTELIIEFDDSRGPI